MIHRPLIAMALLLGSAPIHAQTAPACPPVNAASVWPDGAPLTTDGKLTPGTPAQVTLRPDGEGKRAGSASVAVVTAGIYEVSLGSAIWIDLATGGAVLASTGHGHGPACSGIRKIVRFDMQPGTYEVRLSRSDRDTVQVMVNLAR